MFKNQVSSIKNIATEVLIAAKQSLPVNLDYDLFHEKHFTQKFGACSLL